MLLTALPSLFASPAMAHANTNAVGSTPSSGSSSTSASSATQSSNSAENTFIQLLVTEMQSQDPTSPMDPTTMVSQMFSMNQLQQLIDINQTLSTALYQGPSTAAAASSSAGNSFQANAIPSNVSSSLAQAATLPTSTAAAQYAQQLLTGAH